ncbi:hypothetical protein HUU62_06340 [Rhodoferax sp. 4810]|nr:hypothetical protein [Rhodoferax jenense]
MSTLQELQRQLDAARGELQDFTYAVSHDLRAPLRHINAYAQIIQEDWPDMPAEMAGHLGTIRQSAQLLARQLDGLTQLARLNLQPLSLQAVNVSTLAQEVADELSQQITPPVEWQLARDVPLVRSDAALLRQVLVHLLGNALKFSRQANPAQIALRWRLACPTVPEAGGADTSDAGASPATLCQIEISDNGIGFSPEQAQALFKVFGKLHPAREFEGLGLGLVSCQKIMARLGGSIGMTATVGAGCCVTICLPLAP